MVTIEPQRFFVEQIADSLFSVESLVPAGLSPETYDPAPAQMQRLAVAKGCFYIGGLGFENVWMEKLKANNPNVRFFRNDRSINIIKSEGAECEEGHHHGGSDPHIWTSPKNALIILQNMYEALIEISPENKDFFYSNLQKVSAKIRETDEEIKKILQNSTQKSFIIFHPALTYFAQDYGIRQYAIETEGKEPSPEQLARLVETARREEIRTVFIQPEFDVKNAEIVARETGCRLVAINPLSYNWNEEMLNIAKALSE
jgi:zinc transport system substrate-binding protein